MLTAITLSLISTIMIKSNKLWQTTTKMMVITAIIFLMVYPVKDNTFLLSSNMMLDTLSMNMMALSMWISSLMIISSYKIKKKPKMFLMTITVLLIILTMLFSMNNTILFYILFEFSIIPVLLLIMLWGYQPERVTASFFIIMYTVSASLPLLMMLIMMTKTNYHSNLSMIFVVPGTLNKNLSWLMLITAFLVKLPLFSLHLWLPKAHVEAPLAGSMILAAILLKLGSYGLLRMNKIIYNNMFMVSNLIMSMAMVGGIITNIMCLRQTDLKSLIAYSSVSHMSLMIIGFMSNSKLGQYSSLMIMLSHGLTSSCLFMLTNSMYEKMNSRNIMLMKSNLLVAPITSMMWIITMGKNMALPPSLNTLSEVTTMMSSLIVSKMIMVLLMMISFTTAIYSIYVYSMINHGNQLKTSLPTLQASSTNMTNWLSHSWPLVMFLIMPTKMMTWC